MALIICLSTNRFSGAGGGHQRWRLRRLRRTNTSQNPNTRQEHDSEQTLPTDSTKAQQTALGVMSATRRLTSHDSCLEVSTDPGQRCAGFTYSPGASDPDDVCCFRGCSSKPAYPSWDLAFERTILQSFRKVTLSRSHSLPSGRPSRRPARGRSRRPSRRPSRGPSRRPSQLFYQIMRRFVAKYGS